MNLFAKRPNRKAQTVVTATTAAIAAATGGLGLIALGIGAAAWWVTGKATEK